MFAIIDISRSNKNLQVNPSVWETVGMFEKTPEARSAAAAELDSASAAGVARRAKLNHWINIAKNEFQSLGMEVNQRYHSGAIYSTDEEGPVPLPADPVIRFEPTTYPGAR